MDDSSVVIVSGARTAIGAFGGSFKNLTAPELTAPLMSEVVNRAGIDPALIDDVLWGCCYQRTKDEDATWPYKMDRSLSYIENRLVCGIKLANYKIYETASKDIRFKGMGTTIVTCLINGDKIYIAHVGDSRCYRLRNGVVEQVTRDHSLLEDYKDAKPDMTAEEERNFPHKNVITRALGMRDTVQVDIRTEEVMDADLFLLCSDGLSGMITDEHIRQILTGSDDLEKSVAELVDSANRAGGTDNITTLVLQCSNTEKKASA